MKDFPEYSDEARDVLDLFVLDSVTTIFYFEDSEHETVYERLLEKLIPNLSQFAVICLGGKTKVISKAKECRPIGRTSIFIVDKDFDDLLGCMQTVDSLYYLEKCCMENYFLDVNALKLVCIEEKPIELSNNKADRLLHDKDRFLSQLEERYQQITRLFLVIRKHHIEMETTKMDVSKLLSGADDDFPVPTESWYEHYKKELQQNCTTRANEWLQDDEQLNTQLGSAFIVGDGNTSLSIANHLNGKHLFRCLVRYVQVRLNCDIESCIDSRTLYLRMLSHLDLHELYLLRDRILGEHPEIVGKPVESVSQ